jgi:hypothetical protein
MSNTDHHGMKTLEGLSPFCRMNRYGRENENRDDRFGWMFAGLSPAYTQPEIPVEIGRVGGNMEAPND